MPHNVEIFKDAIGGEPSSTGEIFTGPRREAYDVGPLAGRARTRSSAPSIPTMTGTLTVQ